MNTALAGHTIVVTRPAAQAEALGRAIEAHGGQVVYFPVLEIQPLPDQSAVVACAGRLDEFDLVFFVSPNAVEYGLAALTASTRWPPTLKVAAVGQGSARALAAHGFTDVIAPQSGFDTEAVLALPEFSAAQIQGRAVLILRGDGGRELLGDTLLARGARVEYLGCYHRACPATPAQALLAPCERGDIDALSLTSSEGCDNLLSIVGPAAMECLAALPVFVPHPRIAARCHAHGFTHVHVTASGDEALVHALITYFGYTPDMNTSVPPSASDSSSPTPPEVATVIEPAANVAAEVAAETSTEATTSGVAGEPRTAPTPAPASPPSPAAGWASGWALLLALIALAAVGVALWQGYAVRQESVALRAELAQRLKQGDAIATAARTLAQQQQTVLGEVQGKLDTLEAKVDATEGQAAALETLYQQFSRSEEDRAIVEVEQAVTIAAQQLQLAGNVEAALIALQGAQARLALQDRGQLGALRRALASDIEHLRQQFTLDIPATALQLEQLLGQADALPLAFAEELAPTPRAPGEPSGGGVANFARDMARDVWRDILSLVRIERMDSALEPVLLAPGESRYLRENLKIRLLSARLALLARDGRTYATDLAQARNWIERFFNTRDPVVRRVIDDMLVLEKLPVRIEHRELALSFNALKLFQARAGEVAAPRGEANELPNDAANTLPPEPAHESPHAGAAQPEPAPQP
ncbi:fused uroporphyrinogen-III synthase HemD/membrane protein HemX [Betaproteobacteria bacterium]|nr:fused uroporphyrinogen-III synthase HemD/membrane protein HemX [Betaproteobacteria bacterium]